jgi:hypothetical protein
VPAGSRHASTGRLRAGVSVSLAVKTWRGTRGSSRADPRGRR